MKRLRKPAIVLALLLVAAEILARVKMSYNTGDARYLAAPFLLRRTTATVAETAREDAYDQRRGYYKMRPGVHAAPAPAGYGSFRINRLGFRGADFDPANKAAAKRIICVGDSNTIGLNVNEEETWPAALARSLARQAPGGFEVINAGFNAYTSSHYLNLIRAELLDYSPDVLIVYGGVNDQDPERQLTAKPARALGHEVHQLLYYRSIFYTLALEKFSVMKSDSPVPVTVYDDDRYLKTFADNTGAIIDLCRKKNVRVVFVREMVSGDERLTRRMDRETAVLKNLCESRNVEYLDLTKPFREAQQAGVTVFTDPIHLGAAGYALLADHVSRYLASR
jgi:lysophospholipase L1-like esterase